MARGHRARQLHRACASQRGRPRPGPARRDLSKSRSISRASSGRSRSPRFRPPAREPQGPPVPSRSTRARRAEQEGDAAHRVEGPRRDPQEHHPAEHGGRDAAGVARGDRGTTVALVVGTGRPGRRGSLLTWGGTRRGGSGWVAGRVGERPRRVGLVGAHAASLRVRDAASAGEARQILTVGLAATARGGRGRGDGGHTALAAADYPSWSRHCFGHGVSFAGNPLYPWVARRDRRRYDAAGRTHSQPRRVQVVSNLAAETPRTLRG